jgi:hypothetical protein
LAAPAGSRNTHRYLHSRLALARLAGSIDVTNEILPDRGFRPIPSLSKRRSSEGLEEEQDEIEPELE